MVAHRTLHSVKSMDYMKKVKSLESGEEKKTEECSLQLSTLVLWIERPKKKRIILLGEIQSRGGGKQVFKTTKDPIELTKINCSSQ